MNSPIESLAAAVLDAAVDMRRLTREHTAAKNRRKAAFKAFTDENGGDYYVGVEDNDPACEAAIRECKLSGQSVKSAKAALRYAADRYAAALAKRPPQTEPTGEPR